VKPVMDEISRGVYNACRIQLDDVRYLIEEHMNGLTPDKVDDMARSYIKRKNISILNNLRFRLSNALAKHPPTELKAEDLMTFMKILAKEDSAVKEMIRFVRSNRSSIHFLSDSDVQEAIDASKIAEVQKS
jgi:hypothetical protein